MGLMGHVERVVVISIGGSILASPTPNLSYIKDFSKMLVDLRENGTRAMVVVGGGKAARDYQQAARDLGADDEFCDRVGIGVTRLNAMLLAAALGDDGEGDILVEPIEYTEDRILIMGGVKPGQTTDAVAADLAVANGARLFIEATNVNGVYDSDPRKNPDAKRIESLTFDELIEIVGTEHSPGMNTVIDPKAAGIMKENNLKTYVLNGSDIANMKRAISGKGFDGTTISIKSR